MNLYTNPLCRATRYAKATDRTLAVGVAFLVLTVAGCRADGDKGTAGSHAASSRASRLSTRMTGPGSSTLNRPPEPNTLGQFFIEWGVRLSDSCVGEYCSPEPIEVYVDGQPYTQDPQAIELTDRKEIAIVIGTPPAVIPETADFSNA